MGHRALLDQEDVPQCGNKIEVAKYFPLRENLISIKRFIGSKLPLRFGSNDVYDMRRVMKPYHISTVTCGFRVDEQAAHQFLHREGSRRFLDPSKVWVIPP